jgi:S-adenosyl-L-methionine hydrolase (adenosine-forming)
MRKTEHEVSVPVITFLSDYGLEDDFVGVCHGVIASICPEARVIDLAHRLRRHDVRAGALILQRALPYSPIGVHLAVVDPEVGAARRAVALRLADGRQLVGPDNGLLSLAAEDGGGVVEAVDLARSRFRLQPVAATFHGRDIFAPAAAHLAVGVELPELGDPCDPGELEALALPQARFDDGVLLTHALQVDRFGNVQLDAMHEQLAQTGLKLGRGIRLETTTGEVYRAAYVRTFADVGRGEVLVYEDSSRRLALAVSRGDAAARLGIAVDDELRLSPA